MNRKFSGQEKESICIDYIRPKTHLTMEKLAEKYNCSVGTIHNILEEYQILRRGRGRGRGCDLEKRERNVQFNT